MQSDSVCKAIRDKNNSYTTVNNSLILNPHMSAKAKGLMLYFLLRSSTDKPWKFNMEDFSHHFIDGEESIRSGFKELMRLGYMKRRRFQDKITKRFRWQYLIYEIPDQYDEKDFEETPEELYNG